MAIWKSEILITDAPLPAPDRQWAVTAGAVVDFWGVVRALEEGHEISGIDYECHGEMARHQMGILVEKARAEFALEAVVLRHRIGFVPAGEASLFLRCSSPHRAAAFAGSEWMIVELKRTVPIWKKPLFVRPEEARPTPGAVR